MADETPEPEPRPRPQSQPQYGELAPEGWSWPPPEPEQGNGHGHRHHDREGRAPAPQRPTPKPAASSRTAPAWDRPVTLLLLIAGIVGLFVNIGIISSAPQSLAMLHASENLGGYTMDASVPGLITAAIITQVVLYVLAVAAAVALLVRRRRAFLVPLLVGVLAALVNLAFMTAIVATDHALIEFYGGM